MSLGMQEILPDGGLASFQNEVSRLADLGRYEDAYIVHAAEGETVVPMAVFDENPRLKAMLFAQMRGMGIDPERYIVGNELNSINPVTGQPEFFLKKIFKEAKKAVKKIAPYAGVIAGAMGAGPMASAGIGALGGYYGEGDMAGALKGGLYGYGASKILGEAPIYGEGKWFPGMRAGGKGLFAPSDAWAENKYKMKTLKQFHDAGEIGSVKYAKLMKELKEKQDLLKTGRFPNLENLGWGEKGALGLGATFGVTDLLAMGEEDKDGDGMPDDWYDIQPKHHWGGNFAAPGVDYANGGIINAYDNGGDVHPGTDEITETGIFSPGATVGGASGALPAKLSTGLQDEFDKVGLAEFVDRSSEEEKEHKLAMRLATVLVEPGERVSLMDIKRAKEMMKTMSSEEIGAFIFRRRRELLGGGVGEKWGPTDEPTIDEQKKEYMNRIFTKHSEVEELSPGQKEYMNRIFTKHSEVEELSPGQKEYMNRIFTKGHEYTEDKYADGGIAHLAGGSFPRMSGAISGPGGPRDDMVPAMLSDGEFVMTADAVRNAGGGSRREGARRMYQLMNQLQGVA